MSLAAGPGERVDQCNVGAGDRRRARAAVGLQHVAVDKDAVLTQSLHVDHRAQAAPDEARDLLRAATELALDGLAVVAGRGGARQHRVLRRDPPLARVLQPARDPRRKRRRAQHLGAAKRHEGRTLRMLGPRALEGHGPQLVVGAAIGSGLASIGHGATLSADRRRSGGCIWPPSPVVVLARGRSRARGTVGRGAGNQQGRRSP